MGRVYSLDLRTRVLAAAALNRFSSRALAERFSIGESTVRLWCRLQRTTGQVAPPARRHAGPWKIDAATGLPVVQALVAAQPDATLAELAQAYTQQTGVRVGLMSVWRACRRLGLKRKRKKPAPRRAGHARGRRRGA